MRTGLRQVLLDERSMDRPEIDYFDRISQRKNVDKYGRYGNYLRVDSVLSKRSFRFVSGSISVWIELPFLGNAQNQEPLIYHPIASGPCFTVAQGTRNLR
jgi:hypothetical protein